MKRRHAREIVRFAPPGAIMRGATNFRLPEGYQILWQGQVWQVREFGIPYSSSMMSSDHRVTFVLSNGVSERDLTVGYDSLLWANW